MQTKWIIIGILMLIIFWLMGDVYYTVDMTEQVIITQFGRPIGNAITDAGMHFKIPFIQKVNRFEKRLLEWRGRSNQIPTKDKKYIEVDIYARWRIVDPLKFFQTVKYEGQAQGRLDDIVDSQTRDLIASHNLLEAVRNSNRPMTYEEAELQQAMNSVIDTIKVGRDSITAQILERSREKMLEFGIDIIDVQIKRINYVEAVRKAVYERMITERTRIAERFRSEGRGVKARIEGVTERRLKEIESEAYRKAQLIIGEADANAIRIYANAYNRDPEFYSFLKTLETYKNTIREDDWLILTTDSDYWKYLKTMNGK
ncbi:protease modulator HflC [candidate division KSB1 bacterium]|nr:protease modulator HflC [candidate division KSB1 bacterium]